MPDSVRPHRRQPPRLRLPWDSPGKNTGVGCHFLLQCMKVKSESERAQRRGCRKTSVFLSRETGISGNFVGRIQGAKGPFDLQFLTWDFS